ncbi:MAG: hypothetical protein R3E32_15575 [Chitinophagales bacterium]
MENGKQQYYHQLLGSAALHPDEAIVFSIACEAIVQQGGCEKNDCEQSAAKRLIPKARALLLEEKLIGVFDALYDTGPHIKCLQDANMSYIIVCKGQNFVQLQVAKLRQKEEFQSLTWQKNGKTCTAYFTSDLILNGSHTDIKTNYFEYEQVDNKTNEIVFRGSWITDLPIDKKNLAELVAVARARWKIENEVFNTLKNQGYHLEHNYGHGHKYLATNFALLTFLAFLSTK